MEQYHHILGEIRRVLEKKKMLSAEDEQKHKATKPMLNEAEMIGQIQAVLELSEDFKSKEAAEAVQEILQHEMSEALQKELKEVAKKHKMYDDDSAEEILHALLEELESR